MRNSQEGSAIIMSMLVTVLLLLLAFGLLTTANTEALIAANDQWTEGAFQAAEAAVQEAVDKLQIDATTGVVDETAIGDDYSFYSGTRDDASPQPPTFVGDTPIDGYALGESTGYNPDGFSFAIYRVNGTGSAPREIEREVEVRVEIGPIAE